MGAFGKLQAFLFVTLLAKPFEKWDAYKLGLIDEKGKKIRKPETKPERDSLGVFENLVRKIKSTLLKFLPSSNYLQYVLAAFLLKEGSENLSREEENAFNEINSRLDDSEMKMMMEILEDGYIHNHLQKED